MSTALGTSRRSAKGADPPLWLLALLPSRAAADVQMPASSPIGVLLVHAIEQLQEASTDVAGDFAHHPCRHMVVSLGRHMVVVQGISQESRDIDRVNEGHPSRHVMVFQGISREQVH